MKNFFGYSFVVTGIGAMVVTAGLGLFAGIDASALGGIGLLVTVIGAAILGDK